jgi:hypothetical protein
MQLRRCITRGFRNYSQGASFNLLWVWVITVERVLEMSGFPSIARTVADPSTLSPHQAEQLPETLLSGLRLPSRAVRIVSSLALTARRLALTPLALNTHVTPLTLTFHLSHSPLTSYSHSPLAILLFLRTRNLQRNFSEPATPPNLQRRAADSPSLHRFSIPSRAAHLRTHNAAPRVLSP